MRENLTNLSDFLEAKLTFFMGFGVIPNKLKKGNLPELGTSFLGTGVSSPCLHEKKYQKREKSKSNEQRIKK
jgi:hypothetical protein